MRPARAVVLLGMFIGMVWVFQPIASAHTIPDLQICEAEDAFGEFVFPTAEDELLVQTCADLEGTLVLRDGLEAPELVRWMLDLGFYDPYALTLDSLEDMFGPVATEAPEE